MKKVYFLWGLSLLFKLILSYVVPLSFDEAYYWVWSKNLQLSYYDHPGMVAWLFKLGSIFEGLGHAVRWPHVLVGHLTLLVWVKILQRFVDEQKVKSWFWLAVCSSLIGFGSLVATPDVAVVFFWSLSLYIFQEIILTYNKTKSFSPIQYLLLGAFLGLGFVSKYHIVLFVFSALAFLALERRWNLVSLRGLGLTFISGLIFSLPVLIWNYQHDFVSFRFQLDHGLGESHWDPAWTITYPLGQIMSLFPLVFWYALKAKLESNQRFLYYFSWFPLCFFFLSSFKGSVELNWPIVAYPSVLALAVIYNSKPRWIWAVNAFWIILFSVILSEYTFPWMNNPNPASRLVEGHKFDVIVPAVKKYQPLYASSYQMASVLWYKSKTPTYKLFNMSRKDLFDQIQTSPPTEKVFYVVRDVEVDFPEWILQGDFALSKIESLSPAYELYKVVRQ